MSRLEKIRLKRSKIISIAKSYGASNIRVFGSVARKEERRTSDVDFLVALEPGRSAFELGGLLMDLEELLGCHVDLVTDKGLSPLIRDAVLKEAVNL